MRRHLHLLARLPGQAWRLWWHQTLPALSYLISYLRSPRQAISIWPETTIPLGPRVAIFVHFDASGAVRPDVLHYLSALREAGLSVVFVTNAGRLRPDALAALQPLCAGVIVRRNIGYDFGAMREGIDQLGLPREETEMVLLVNDSVYGPLQPLAPLLERLDFTRADLWGLTESWQTRYHLQSYFVAFGRAALHSPAWTAFWRSVRPVSSKWWVILRYEIGLTQQFLRHGLRAQALWRYDELLRQVAVPEVPKAVQDETTGGNGSPLTPDPVLQARVAHTRHIRAAAARGVPLNPSADLWRQLLLSDFPFVKRELIRQNPTGIGDAAEWREVARTVSTADLDAIESDLKRVMRNRAP